MNIVSGSANILISNSTSAAIGSSNTANNNDNGNNEQVHYDPEPGIFIK